MRTFAISILGLCLGVSAQAPWEPDEFPIACWRGPPQAHNTLEHYQMLSDGNFTVAGPTGGHTVESNRRVLDLCEEVGLKAILVDGRIGPQLVLRDDWGAVIKAIVADYGEHPALYGYHLRDEPGSLLFGPLGQISRELEKQDPAHLPYINLLPTYASSDQLGTPTYREHLRRFIGTTRPRLLSYDHYALRKDGSFREDYYENMELVRTESLRTGIPWWYVHHSGAYSGYRAPTSAEMRWQVYTSLAYGTGGISYWYYWGHVQQDDDRTGVVDPQGKPTRLYDLLKPLNHETRVLGNVLLSAISTDVYHVGDIPRGTRRQGGDDVVQLPVEKPLLAGVFRGAGSMLYAMVVNRDTVEAVEADVRFLPHVTAVARISAQDGTSMPLPVEECQLVLDPGEGALLRLTTAFEYPSPPKILNGIDFRFDEAGNLEGWGGFAGLSGARVADGILSMEMGARDPHMQRDYLRVPGGTYRGLRVRMRLTSGAPSAQVFWITSDEPEYSATRHMNFAVLPDGEWHEYTVILAGHELWAEKEIRGIRLDPTVGDSRPGARVDIDWIVGVPEE